MSEALDVSRRLVGAGISVLPIDAEELPSTSMLPVVEDDQDPVHGTHSWKHLQERLPTDDELVAWFGRGKAAPARIHGGASGNCETIEISGGGYVFQGWLKSVRAAFPDLASRLTIISTPFGGWDVFYRCSGPAKGSQRLAEVPAGDDGQWKTLIGTRGQGDYSVCPGGPFWFAPYRVIAGPPVWRPETISAEEREALLSAARKFNQRPSAGGVPPGEECASEPGRQSEHDAHRPESPGEPFQARLKAVSGLEVEPKEIEWLWRGRIPAGKLTILSALPGAGTTFVSCQLAACVTTGGSWPDGSGHAPAGEVAFLNSEDSLEETLLPRLIAHGADRSKVYFIEAVEDWDREGRAIEREVRFDIDIGSVRGFLESHPAVRLLVVDPISAYLGTTDTGKNGEARAVLGPLCKLAEDFGVAVVGISHLPQGRRGTAATHTLKRMQAPAVWIHVQDENDPDRVLWLPVKMKLARRPRGLAYRIVEGRVEWETGTVEVSAEEALNQAIPKGDRVSQAAAWLRRELAGGEWVKTAEIETQLDEAGISYSTYKRAKKLLNVESTRGFGQDGWCLRLPEESPSTRDRMVEPVGPLEPLEPDERVEPLEPDETVEPGSTSAHGASLSKANRERVSQVSEVVDSGWEEFDREFANFDREFDEIEDEPP